MVVFMTENIYHWTSLSGKIVSNVLRGIINLCETTHNSLNYLTWVKIKPLLLLKDVSVSKIPNQMLIFRDFCGFSFSLQSKSKYAIKHWILMLFNINNKYVIFRNSMFNIDTNCNLRTAWLIMTLFFKRMCKGKLLLDLVTTWRKLVRMPKCLATYIEKKMSWDLFNFNQS